MCWQLNKNHKEDVDTLKLEISEIPTCRESYNLGNEGRGQHGMGSFFLGRVIQSHQEN